MNKAEGTKFVNLSTKSLEKITNWARENDRSTLCRMYELACYTANIISDVDTYQFYLETRTPKKHNHDGMAYWDIYGRAYNLRDSIGRVILKKINREKMNKRGAKT